MSLKSLVIQQHGLFWSYPGRLVWVYAMQTKHLGRRFHPCPFKNLHKNWPLTFHLLVEWSIMNNEAFSDGFTLTLQTIANSQTTGAERDKSESATTRVLRDGGREVNSLTSIYVTVLLNPCVLCNLIAFFSGFTDDQSPWASILHCTKVQPPPNPSWSHNEFVYKSSEVLVSCCEFVIMRLYETHQK